ncbi:hypothetical protein VMCG_06954 [Cytospora schulzeri]|uniref:Carbohydrate kinase PfkB domain-containing protein n=1 Tax=Cytospora schulzeri TaxID=448051 RepID=A0A423W3V0_9PEZI|nr:hypothetical protein VMCG_06954 [Valsa malicola]
MGQSSMSETHTRDSSFVSLGMAVIDEIRFPTKETLLDVPGGSGLYATLGARLLQAAPRSKSVGYVLLAGYDFPEAILHLLQKWETRLHIHQMPNHPSTRGLLIYEDDAFGRKSFVYTSPPLQPRPSDLETYSLLQAKSFHFLSLPEDLEVQVMALLELRKNHGVSDRPLIVWEPAPIGCDRVNLDSHFRACKLVDVFSPNHLELGYLFEGKREEAPEFSRSNIEMFAKQFLDSGIGPKVEEGLIVIRAGEHGALTLSTSGPEWLPPFYEKPSAKVVDPTGAGNTFLGGFCVTLQETGNPREASIRGTVAASYALEQFGLPQCSPLISPGSEEAWNGSNVSKRIDDFKRRLSEESKTL